MHGKPTDTIPQSVAQRGETSRRSIKSRRSLPRGNTQTKAPPGAGPSWHLQTGPAGGSRQRADPPPQRRTAPLVAQRAENSHEVTFATCYHWLGSHDASAALDRVRNSGGGLLNAHLRAEFAVRYGSAPDRRMDLVLALGVSLLAGPFALVLSYVVTSFGRMLDTIRASDAAGKEERRVTTPLTARNAATTRAASDARQPALTPPHPPRMVGPQLSLNRQQLLPQPAPPRFELAPLVRPDNSRMGSPPVAMCREHT